MKYSRGYEMKINSGYFLGGYIKQLSWVQDLPPFQREK